MAARNPPARPANKTAPTAVAGPAGKGNNACRRPSANAAVWEHFDASKLPSLDVKDFQWGTPTATQQQQLYQQFVQMAFMYASSSPSHPAGHGYNPMMMPGCPPMFPMGCLPGAFPAYPPPGYCAMPMMAPPPVSAPPPATRQGKPLPAPALPPPALPQYCAPLPKKEPSARLYRATSDVSDASCRLGGGADQDTPKSRQPQQQAQAAPLLSSTCGAAAPPPVSAPIACRKGLAEWSTDDLCRLFGDDPLMFEDLDTGSVDEGSMGGGGGGGGSLGSAGTVGGLDAELTLEDVFMMGDDDGEEAGLHLDSLAAAFDLDDDAMCALTMAPPALDSGDAADDGAPPLRFPANATGHRSPRCRARGVCAFAAAARHIAELPPSAAATPWVVPSVAVGPGRLRSGVRKQRSGSLRARSPTALALAVADSEPLCSFGGFMGVESGSGRSSDEWETGMCLDLDAAFYMPMDMME